MAELTGKDGMPWVERGRALLARSPMLAGITLGGLAVLLTGLEQGRLVSHGGAGLAADPANVAMHLGIIGLLGVLGWLLGTLARRCGNLDDVMKERTAFLESWELSRVLYDDRLAQVITVDTEGRITGLNTAARTAARPVPALGDRLFAGVAGEQPVSSAEYHGSLDGALADCLATQTMRDFADVTWQGAHWNLSITPFSKGAAVSLVDVTEQWKRQKIQRALYNILDATTRSQTLHDLLASIHEQVKTVMRANNFFVATYDPASDRYTFLYRVDEHDKYPLNTPLDLSGGFTDLVRKTGTPKLGHREDVERLLEAKTLRMLGKAAESWLGVPFQSGRDVGVVVVQSYSRGNRYTLSDQDALQVISGQIGLAIERKRTEDEIARRQQLLERILDNVSMGFAINNTVTGQVFYVNDAFPRAYRISREDCTDAASFFRAVYGERRELGQRILDDVASGDPARMVWEEVEMVDRHGETFFISASNIPLPEQQLMISTVLDVTAQKRLRDKQAELENRLQLTQKMESIGVLAGGIAHDFNNLLTAILGNLNMARDEQDPVERAAFLDQASNACVDSTHLTRQLLTFARGGEPVRKVAYLRYLLMETVGFALSGSNVKAEFAIDEALSAVEVDEGQLKQVIHNLVINAKQAMPDGGRVVIRATNEVRRDQTNAVATRIVRISVRDSGPGIAAQHLERIFEPYFTTKLKGSGTGLGLATAFSIIRRHGGTLSVESELGRGSEFVIELPASDKPVERAGAHHPLLADGGGRKILIMDDEEAIRRVAEQMLASCGYQVVSVPDGRAALDAYDTARRNQEPFAAVILDLTVPGAMGGLETIAGLRAIDPEVRAIVSSGYSDANERSTYRDQGFAASLQKPYTRDILARTMARVLDLA